MTAGDADVLVVDAGPAGTRLSLVGSDGRVQRLAALEEVEPDRVRAVGHRVAHGGGVFGEAVPIDEAVLERIASLDALAPNVNAPAVRGIEAAMRALPGVPHAAAFDTAFHATIPEEASTYALPESWRTRWGLRRHGFHGLSARWSSERAPELLGRPGRALRLVVCHLGRGSSVTAVLDGRSVDTTMGFTPMEGVPMATRSGSLDPGALIYLLRESGISVEALDHELNEHSGLAGLSGSSGEVRALEAAAARGDRGARLALAVFVHRLAGAVAAMTAALGGLDALVFTAGIGEGSAGIRAAVCARLAFLGVALDGAANAAARPDCEISAAGARARTLVIAAREELVVARAARAALAVERSPAPSGR